MKPLIPLALAAALLLASPRVADAQMEGDFFLSVTGGVYALPTDAALLGAELGIRAWFADYLTAELTLTPVLALEEGEATVLSSLVVGARLPGVASSSHAVVLGVGATVVPVTQRLPLAFAGRLGYEYLGEELDFRVWLWVPALVPTGCARDGGPCNEWEVFPMLGLSVSIGLPVL